MIRGAVFDIDGTILDSLGIWEEADERYLMEQGIRPEKDLGRILYPMTMQEACAYIRKHYPVKDTESGIAASILKIVENFYQKEAPLKEGAAGFLRSLSQEGLPIIAATTGEKASPWHPAAVPGDPDLHTDRSRERPAEDL